MKKLNKLSKQLNLMGHIKEAKYVNHLCKQAIEWPWDAWNNLPEKPKAEMMDLLNKFSYIPVIGVAGDSAQFVLNLFSKDYAGAAKSFLMIIISFVLQVKMTGKILTLQKASGSVIKDFIQTTLRKNKDVQAELIGLCINLVNDYLDQVISQMSKYISQEMLSLKSELQNIKGEIKGCVEEAFWVWSMAINPSHFN